MNPDELRRILDTEAQRVEVRPDALAVIRRRIAARPPRWHPSRWFPGGVMITIGTGVATAAVATVVAAVVGLGSCGPQPGPPEPPPIAAPTSQPPTTGGPSTPAASPVTAAVPVYYVHGDRGFPRLYREYHSLPVGDGSSAARTSAALVEMLDGLTAYDKDYYSVWEASARVRGVRIDGNAVVVDLTGVFNGTGPGQRDPNDIKQAVQQLIWTATAASGKDTVRLLLDGRSVATLSGVVSIGGDLRRGPAVDVLGLVWVRDPQQGATVGRTVQVNVSGIVFEATMRVLIKRDGVEVY
ncbi:MAG TPA: GerMN domain-containing protein, partial [Micromonosporaceae bacterium]|nr:GerMN domain-containing protein [Micromonosporaceae bacterium]